VRAPSFKYLNFNVVTPDAGGIEHGGSYAILEFNRPERKNAINIPLYNEIVDALEYASKEETIRAVIITGKGEYYSSGNDLSVFMGSTSVDEALMEGERTLDRFIKTFIRFPKILIAAVNGPAIGVAATTLMHCDFVYASETATFNTPFVPLGQTAEACSSETFPRAMGFLKANEILILGKKLTAQEALQFRMVNSVFPPSKLMEETCGVASQIALSPPLALMDSKKLIKNEAYLQKLESVNEIEVKTLVNRWKSAEFMQAIMSFMTRKTPTSKM